MKKKILLGLCLLLATGVILAPGAKSRMKPYYKGDAISYNGSVIVASTNMNAIELFKLEGGKLARTAKIESFRAIYSGYESFNDVLLMQEGANLFAYATDGTYLYKYDITDQSRPVLLKQMKDNNWDWFGGLAKNGNRLVTIGTKGVKFWNTSIMDVVETYGGGKTNNFYNVTLSPDGKTIFDINEDEVTVYDTQTRSYASSFKIAVAEDHGRKMYNDGNANAIFVADDSSLKLVDFSGNVVRKFDFTSDLGYDVVPSTGGDYLYFTDGMGVVKMTKDDFKAVAWTNTLDMGGSGGWAMGLKVVNAGGKDHIVIFNNSNILVLDSALKKVSSVEASIEDSSISIKTPLFLNVSRTTGGPGAEVILVGGGFGANEPLTINFGDKMKLSAKADANGAFSQNLVVPTAVKGGMDIRVDGMTTGQHYNIGFFIQ